MEGFEGTEFRNASSSPPTAATNLTMTQLEAIQTIRRVYFSAIVNWLMGVSKEDVLDTYQACSNGSHLDPVMCVFHMYGGFPGVFVYTVARGRQRGARLVATLEELPHYVLKALVNKLDFKRLLKPEVWDWIRHVQPQQPDALLQLPSINQLLGQRQCTESRYATITPSSILHIPTPAHSNNSLELPVLTGDADAHELLLSIACLGGEVDEILFSCAEADYALYDSSGEPARLPPLELPAVFTSGQRKRNAIVLLKKYNFLEQTADLTYVIPLRLFEWLEQQASSATKTAAMMRCSKLLCHAFPPCQDLLPVSYSATGRKLLVNARHVMEYLVQQDGHLLRSLFELKYQERLIEFCLSFSILSSGNDKFLGLEVASKVVELDLQGLFAARIDLRKKELYRLYPSRNLLSSRGSVTFYSQQSGNAYFGESLLFDIQHMIDTDDLPRAWAKLDIFKPLNATSPSELESRLMARITLFKGRICRFAGRFDDAKSYLQKLLYSSTRDISAKLEPMIISHLIAVHCELGAFNDARLLLNAEEKNKMFSSWKDHGRGRRFALAQAEVYLMEALSLYITDVQTTRILLQKAENTYGHLLRHYQQLLDPGLPPCLNKFEASAGLAMNAHMLCEISDTVDKTLCTSAIFQWEATLDIANLNGSTFGWVPKFQQMIIFYSISDLLFRIGWKNLADLNLEKARTLYSTTGCQTHCVGLGSVWFRIISEWTTRGQRSGISALVTADNDYPFELGSIRPI